jgi:3-oxoacyl-[acyl-carrier protein] reductase
MKLAVITGASAGIGCSAAELFSARGYRVVNLSRRACPVPDVINLSCDLSNPARVESVCDEVQSLQQEAEITCLVHNACLMRKDSATECDSSQLREVLEINLVGTNSINQRLIAGMQRGSSVIYIGSTLSEKAVANSFSYVISKHAVIGMMRATCQDLQGTGVHTACVCPGFTDTEMLRNHLGNDSALLQEIGGANSFQRLVTPDEIARMIAWVHDSPVVNGSVLHGNLGQLEH